MALIDAVPARFFVLGASDLAHQALTVGTSASTVTLTNTTRRFVVQNLSGGTLYWRKADDSTAVTTANGFPLANQEPHSFFCEPGQSIQLIADAPAQDVRVVEFPA